MVSYLFPLGKSRPERRLVSFSAMTRHAACECDSDSDSNDLDNGFT
jgi:hypothetical protein